MGKPGILFTAGSYAEPAVNACITTGYSPRKGPLGHEPAVIRITAGYLKTVGEGPGGEQTFYGSVSFLSNSFLALEEREER